LFFSLNLIEVTCVGRNTSAKKIEITMLFFEEITIGEATAVVIY
jgi:hypothetical protein